MLASISASANGDDIIAEKLNFELFAREQRRRKKSTGSTAANHCQRMASGMEELIERLMRRNCDRMQLTLYQPKDAPMATVVDHLDETKYIDETPETNKLLLSPLSDTYSQVRSSNILTINVSGLRFQTFVETLERFPDTLLGNPKKREAHLNPHTGEYFFDRHRGSFDTILYFYQSGGRLKRPNSVPVDIFIRELKYFEMGQEILEKLWESEGYRKPEELPLPDNLFQRKVWQIMEHPDTSLAARIVAFISVFVIVLSTVTFCLETLPTIQHKYRKFEPINATADPMLNSTEGNNTVLLRAVPDHQNPFYYLEYVCIIWFTLEFTLRFLSCPSKLAFCKSFLNFVDAVAIAPFYINLAVSEKANTSMGFAVVRVLRLVRVFRIFKLSRHSRGLQVLGLTFKASIQELCLLVFFLMIGLVLFASAVYFAESGEPNTGFTSIPASFWYAIVTMTTVGYGDLTPTSGVGKLVGSLCAIVGVLVLALPVPVIVGNFKHFYRQESRLAHMTAMENDDNFDDVESVSS